jgi:CheY-like chemotaxis protein
MPARVWPSDEGWRRYIQFLTLTAHELRGPAQSVQGLSELLLDLDPPEGLRETLTAIVRDAARLALVVEDLEVRRELAEDTLVVRREPVRTQALLDELATTLERLYPGRLELAYDAAPDVLADERYVRLILNSRLHTALRASPETESCRLSVLAGDGDVAIGVWDQAPRIADAVRPCLFEPLPPVELPHARPGQVFGLYAGQALARRMGGELEFVEDDGGDGATLAVPSAARPPARGNGLVLRLPRYTGDDRPGREAPAPLRVLVVDDDPGVRDFARLALQDSGLAHSVVASACQALAEAARAWPAVVVIDPSLPGEMDGWALWDALCAGCGGEALNVIVFSGAVTGTDEQLIRGRGGRVLRKPAGAQDFLGAIRQAGARPRV